MENLDLEAFEELMQKEQQNEKLQGKSGSKDDGHSKADGKRHRSQRRRSNSYSDHRGGDKKRSRRRRSRGRSSSYSDDSSERKRRHKSRRANRRDSSDSRGSKKSNDPAEIERKKLAALEKNLAEAKKQAEEAQRDDCTVLVNRIHLAVDEKELYMFLTQAGVGKIRDVRLIRDQRSGKSKG